MNKKKSLPSRTYICVCVCVRERDSVCECVCEYRCVGVGGGAVEFLGWEDPMEEGIAIQYSILTWRILAWTEEPGGLQLMGLQRVGPY